MISKTIKHDFPIFSHHPEMVYLDSAATTQKPQTVIAKNIEYYEKYCANIARGLYPLSEQATTAYEKTREMTAEFIHANQPEEIIFTRGTTESINLLSYTLEKYIGKGDEILVTVAEHHSNFLPWQALAKRKKAVLKVLDIYKDGQFKLDTLPSLITPKTKIFAFGYVSNVLGIINPVANIVAQVKALHPNIITIVDAAQAMAHMPVNVKALDCDFLAFSAHKMFGPTGVGVLYGKHHLLEKMSPFQYGGEMVIEAGIDNSTFKSSPHKFEAGTPDISGVIAFQEALKYIQKLGYKNIREHELEILTYALGKLQTNFGDEITLFGTKDISKRSGVITFSLARIHPHDIAQLLGEKNICIRAGQHCTAPLHDALHIPATARLSVSAYTTREDIDKFIEELKKIQKLFEK